MDIDARLTEIHDFAEANANLWHFTGRSGEHWGFIFVFNDDCRVIVTVAPLGFCVRTHDHIHTTAGQDIAGLMQDVERYFLDRYGHKKS